MYRACCLLACLPSPGPSEWHYAWIAVFGPFAGGALAGLAYLAIEGLDEGVTD